MKGKLKIKNQQGLTLIELMIAITIGLLMLTALMSMLSGSMRHFKVQDDFSRMQENGGFALNAIGYDVRMGGFFGKTGLPSLSMISGSDPIAASTGDDCGAAWVVNFLQPVYGYSGLDAFGANLQMNCIDTENFLAGSPILILRGGGGQLIAAPLPNTLYLQATPATAILFNGSNYPAVMPNPIPPPWLAKLDGITPASIYAYQARAYYLRPCSRPTGAATSAISDQKCLVSDDGGHPIPTLVRQELDGLAMVEQPVAEGIERLSVQYGLASSGTVQYKTAPQPYEFGNVVSIRVAVLARSTTLTAGYNDSGKSYDLGDGSAPFTCTAAVNCAYHRHVFSQTFQVRNLVQRSQP